MTRGDADAEPETQDDHAQTDRRDYGAIIDDVVCETCDLPAYRTPVDGPPDPDRHGNRRWHIICPRPSCEISGSMTIPPHGGRLVPVGFRDTDD